MTLTQRQSVLPDKWLNILDKFVYSNWYLLALTALVVLFWALRTMVIGFVVLLLILSFLIAVKRDLTPCLPIILSIYCIISKAEFPPYFAYMFIIFVPVFGSLFFHFYYYRVDKPAIGKFGLAYLFVLASMVLGGIAVNDLMTDRLKGFGFACYLGILPFAIYLLTVNYCKELSHKKFVEYLGRSMVALGLIISIQLLIYYIRVYIGIIPKGSEVHLGWGISNGAATVLLATMAVTMYVAVINKSPIKSVMLALFAIAQYLAVILTISRGAILCGAVEFCIMIIASLVKTKYKKTYFAIYALGIAVLAILAYVFRDSLMAFIERAFNNGLDGSGRDKIYAEAVRVFKQHPLFGVGFGYIGDNSYLNTHPMYYFHSTLFQTIASLGIFGTVASVIMYYKRVKLAFSKGTAFNVFWIIACIGFEGYAMINTFTFLAVPGLLIIAIMTAVNERSNLAVVQQSFENVLPAKE